MNGPVGRFPHKTHRPTSFLLNSHHTHTNTTPSIGLALHTPIADTKNGAGRHGRPVLNTPPLLTLLYVSAAVRPFSNDELIEMLQSFKKRNIDAEITGILLYKDQSFMQILEGPPEAVRQRFRAIERDSRHKNVIKVVEEPISERSFGEWSMGYRNIGQAPPEDIEGFNDLLYKGHFDAERVRKSSRQICSMIKAFIHVNR